MSTTNTNRGGKYLTFALGNEGYGIEIMRVREIFGYVEPTAVPHTPSYVRGVINLRGQVISVIDLRAKFGMTTIDRTDETCIIVVETMAGGRKISTGLIVDRVSDPITIANENIEDAPAMGLDVGSSVILGMGKVGSAVKILLDIDAVLAGTHIESLAA